MCGGTHPVRPPPGIIQGLSPRVRGNHGIARVRLTGQRSIPACAGEPQAPGSERKRGAVYPRVCGGTIVHGQRCDYSGGLSPRVRGNPLCRMWAPTRCGSIPACAGEPATAAASAGYRRVYPRVCGGTSFAARGLSIARGLSPRVRGNQRPARCCPTKWRSIPACAGEPRRPPHAARPCTVYPRVCGGTRRCSPP